jgi:small subunit ribosomal protein S16
MLSIRLVRTGKTHSPHYRIVVQEKRSKLNGGSIAIIGHYHPASKDKLLVVDQDQARHWISKGAQASDTVTNLLVKVGVLDQSKKVHHFYTPPAKAEAAEVAEKTPEVAAATEEASTESVSNTTTMEEETMTTPVDPTVEVAAEMPATEVVVAEEAPAAEEEMAA